MHVKIGKTQLTFYVSKLEKRTGICSKDFNSEKHCLLWDFDDAELTKIIESLTIIQKSFKLPNIYIVSSSPYKYHAYSFAARSFRETICILSATPEIDVDYLRIGATRGYYTLRISPRDNDSFKLARLLRSPIPEDMNKFDITVNEYWTSNKGNKQ